MREQARGLIEGGADLLLVETIFDTLNAKAASSPDRRGVRGARRAAAGDDLRHHHRPVRPHAVGPDARRRSGTRCATPARSRSGSTARSARERCAPTSAEIARVADTLVCAYPNAGLPNEFGLYDESPEYMAALLGEFAAAGLVNIVGGCCGTTPDHIRAIARRGEGHGAARHPAGRRRRLRLSGLEPFTLTPDIPLRQCRRAHQRHRLGALPQADHRGRLRGGARRRARPGRERRPDHRRQHGRGPARFREGHGRLPQPGGGRARHRARAGDGRFLEVRRHRGRAEMRAGQGGRQLDLAEGGRGGVHRATPRSCAATAPPSWSWPSTSRARPTRSSARPRSAQRAYEILTEQVGFPPRTSSSIRTSSRSRPASRSTTTTASTSSRRRAGSGANLPHAHVSGGVSNLSFSFRGNEPVREAMHSVFLYHAIKAGMDMGIVNAGQLAVYDELEPELREACEDVVLNRRADATERLLALAERYQAAHGKAAKEADLAWREWPVEQAARRTRWSTASPTSSRPTPRRRALAADAPARRDRGPADGRHERRRRPVRLRQDVPAAGGEVGARDEAGGRLSAALHGARRRRASGGAGTSSATARS